METLWKVRQRNVLCNKKKSFKLASKKKKIIGFKLCLKIKKCSKMTSANLTLVNLTAKKIKAFNSFIMGNCLVRLTSRVIDK